MKYTIEIQEKYGKCKKYTKKIIEKDFFSKNPYIEWNKKRSGKAEKGGALIRAGAHIRDNTVLKILRQQFRPL